MLDTTLVGHTARVLHAIFTSTNPFTIATLSEDRTFKVREPLYHIMLGAGSTVLFVSLTTYCQPGPYYNFTIFNRKMTSSGMGGVSLFLVVWATHLLCRYCTYTCTNHDAIVNQGCDAGEMQPSHSDVFIS